MSIPRNMSDSAIDWRRASCADAFRSNAFVSAREKQAKQASAKNRRLLISGKFGKEWPVSKWKDVPETPDTNQRGNAIDRRHSSARLRLRVPLLTFGTFRYDRALHMVRRILGRDIAEDRKTPMPTLPPAEQIRRVVYLDSGESKHLDKTIRRRLLALPVPNVGGIHRAYPNWRTCAASASGFMALGGRWAPIYPSGSQSR